MSYSNVEVTAPVFLTLAIVSVIFQWSMIENNKSMDIVAKLFRYILD